MSPARFEPPISRADESAVAVVPLLGRALVAYAIEFDNEFEHRAAHRTTLNRRPEVRDRPWLTSLVMWTSCIRYLPDDGVTVNRLRELARCDTNLDGMRRWGYVSLERRNGAGRGEEFMRPTAKGIAASKIWPAIPDEIDGRWRTRFGESAVDDLRLHLEQLQPALPSGLPDFLPILRSLLFCRLPKVSAGAERDPNSPTTPLFTLLAQPLLAVALEFERDSDLSLAVTANVLWRLDDSYMPIRELPAASGVSREAVNMALTVLRNRRYVEEAPHPDLPRTPAVRLSPNGSRAAQVAYNRLESAVETMRHAWGNRRLNQLTAMLEPIVGDGTRTGSPLFGGLTPYADGWRAATPQRDILPFFPMPLHRGGYPDGS